MTMRSNKAIVNAAGQTITTAGLAAGGALNPEQAQKFIQQTFEATPLSGLVRHELRKAKTGEIDKIGVGRRLLRKKTENTDDGYRSGVKHGKLEYACTPVRLPWEITEETLRENIEGSNYETIVTNLMTRQIGCDREDLCLNGDDEQAGAVASLRSAQEALNGIKTLDDELMDLFNRLDQSVCEVYDLAEIVRDRRAQFEFSPEELDAVEARCDQLRRLERKYGPSVEEMLTYLERCRSERNAMETAEDLHRRLEAKRAAAYKQVLAQGEVLTGARRQAARELEGRILKELRDLDMPNVRFAIRSEPQDPAADGCDQIRFLMSANAGEDLKPIAKVASGGELARIMLALKNVLAEQEAIGTLVFDEVDTGVSGRAAQKVAEKLAQVSRHKQVLCVTHLPQLAAMADTHFSVFKRERDGRTFTEVLPLDRDARKRELARITGGTQVTRALLESAGELLDAAERYRSGL